MDLILLVCLAAAPNQCHEEYLPVAYQNITPTACVMGAQPVIAQWSSEHPEVFVTRWRCGRPVKTRDI